MNAENKEKAIGAGLGLASNPALQWLVVILLILASIYFLWAKIAAWYDKTFNSKTPNGATGFAAHVADAFGFATSVGPDDAASIAAKQQISADFPQYGFDPTTAGAVGAGTVLPVGSAGVIQTSADVPFDPTQGIGI